MHHAPAAEIGSESDGSVCRQDNGPVQFSPVCQHVGLGHESSRVECACDNSHCLLSIVAAVAEAVCRSGQQLQLAKPLVDLLRGLTPQQIRSEEHTSELQSHVNLVCRLMLENKKKLY